MNAKIAAAVMALGAVAVLAACSRSERSPAPSPAPSAAVTAAASNAAAEGVRAVIMNSVVLGHSLSADGSVGAPGVTFVQGQPLFVSLNVSAISPGTEVKLSWYSPTGASEGDDQLVLPTGATIVNFRAKDTSAWPPGTHRVEIWVGGAKAGEKTFTITPAGGSAPSSPR
jgi:hypothetical protein